MVDRRDGLCLLLIFPLSISTMPLIQVLNKVCKGAIQVHSSARLPGHTYASPILAVDEILTIQWNLQVHCANVASLISISIDLAMYTIVREHSKRKQNWVYTWWVVGRGSLTNRLEITDLWDAQRPSSRNGTYLKSSHLCSQVIVEWCHQSWAYCYLWSFDPVTLKTVSGPELLSFLFLLSAFSLVKILWMKSDYGHLTSDLVKITRENIKRSIMIWEM